MTRRRHIFMQILTKSVTLWLLWIWFYFFFLMNCLINGRASVARLKMIIAMQSLLFLSLQPTQQCFHCRWMLNKQFISKRIAGYLFLTISEFSLYQCCMLKLRIIKLNAYKITFRLESIFYLDFGARTIDDNAWNSYLFSLCRTLTTRSCARMFVMTFPVK